MPAFDRSADVLEASYRLHGADREWLQGIAVAARDARPVKGFGDGVAGFLFEAAPAGTSFRSWGHLILGGPTEAVNVLQRFHSSLTPPAIRARYWRQPLLCATLTELGLPSSAEQHSLGVPELLGLQAIDGSGQGLCLLFGLPDRAVVHDRTRSHWAAVVQHVRAGMRLRRTLASDSLWNRVEAVIEPGRAEGAVCAATGPARDREVQARLRSMVRAIDSARTQEGRQDGEAVLAAWPALVSGRWTLVEHIESDGRRYYVAVRNEPDAAALVALTPREQAVVEQVAQGAPNKLIADALGISEPSVASYLRRAMSKLRVRSRAELVALAAEVAATRLPLGEDDLWVLHGGGAIDRALALCGLTRAEQDVASGILQGLSNEAIARARGAAMRTVANQVQSIYRKATALRHSLGEHDTVGSRSELVHLVNRLMLRQHEASPGRAAGAAREPDGRARRAS